MDRSKWNLTLGTVICVMLYKDRKTIGDDKYGFFISSDQFSKDVTYSVL